jgi:tripartite-type tricarboxylate transporter receptor subunit TctC
VFAPAKTPKAIIDKLNVELVKAAQSPDMRSRLASIGVDALGSDVKTLAAYLPQQMAKMAEAVKMSGAKVDR